MLRTLQVVAIFYCLLYPLAAVRAANTHFWLSTQGFPSVSPLPSSSTTVPEFVNFKGQAGGSIYIWGRPEVGQTLENWSLNLRVSDTSVLTFTSSDVYESNVTSVNRWQDVGEPTANSTQIIRNIAGFSPTHMGLGIGSGTQGSDLYYDSVRNGWLLAKVNYSLQTFTAFKSANLFLQIGSRGMSNLNGDSIDVNAVFGHATETALNAANADDGGQRQTSSVFPDGVIKYYDKPDADFDGDTDVDGRDFLIWQRNFGTTTLLNANGNANPGGAAGQDNLVNHVDLAAWQFQYDTTVFPTLVAVPEPNSAVLFGAFCAFWTAYSWSRQRGRGGCQSPLYPLPEENSSDQVGSAYYRRVPYETDNL